MEIYECGGVIRMPDWVWGVDSSAPANEQLLNCVRTNFGNPRVWGRYIRTVPGAAEGLTRREAEFLHAQGITILPIFSAFRQATGYDQGRIAARNAIYHAKLLEIPQGVVIFANIERFFAVDADWIRAWADTFYNSDYKPGYYHDPMQGGFRSAFCQAASVDSRVRTHSILWSAEPEPGVSGPADAPDGQPASPPCGGNVWAWQYGRDAEACPIDTNLIDSRLMPSLW